MIVLHRLVASAACLLSLALVGPATASDAPPLEAVEHLRGIIGTWDCVWEYLGPDGEVSGRVTGVETARWALEDRIVSMRTEIPASGQVNESLLFYNSIEDKLYLASVDARGALWILSGPSDGHVITSEPTRQADGSLLEIRFTHSRLDENHLSALMEYRRPGEQEWTMGFRQTLARRSG